jgi:hypothetical protein
MNSFWKNILELGTELNIPKAAIEKWRSRGIPPRWQFDYKGIRANYFSTNL